MKIYTPHVLRLRPFVLLNNNGLLIKKRKKKIGRPVMTNFGCLDLWSTIGRFKIELKMFPRILIKTIGYFQTSALWASPICASCTSHKTLNVPVIGFLIN
jgi:hypothetical protein